MSVVNLDKTRGIQEPMFFGNGLGLQRFDKYKYPVFKQLAARMEGYFWRPEEIPLDKDISDYKLLSPAEQRIFLLNLSYQILLDSVQRRAIVPAFGAVASLPELEPCLNIWQMFETLHSRSYSYIIENLYPNPSKIFDQVLEIEPLVARSNSLTDAYDKMIALSCKYTLDKDQFNNKAGQERLRRTLLDSLVAVYILESIRFYISFACTFALGELKLMEGNAKIIQLIQRDEQCFIEGTEILTPRGWVDFRDLSPEDTVAQYTQQGEIEFVKPIRKIAKNYEGEMVSFKTNRGLYESVVTADHDIVYSTSEDPTLRKAKAGEFNPSCIKRFPISGTKTGSLTALSDLDRFRIALQADGSMTPSKIRRGEITGCRPVAFGLTKERKKERLESILANLGWEYTKSESSSVNKSNEHTYYVKIPQEYFRESKSLDWVDLSNISTQWAREFVEELALWDGHTYREDRIYYSTTDTTSADIVQAVLTMTNWHVARSVQVDNRKSSYKDVHRFYVLKSAGNWLCTGAKPNTKSSFEYSGNVYCVTVPSGMVVVRYNNKVAVSGNCHQSLSMHMINILTEKEGYEPYFDRERAAEMFKEAAEEEKAWARFLFQEGSMIGLNDKILSQYIEFLTNQRAAAIGIRKIYADAPTKTPLPWMTNWTSSRSTQVAPQETQITSYMVSSVKQEKVDLGDFSL